MNAFDGAYRKGMIAFRAGEPCESPYVDRRADWHNMITFSRGFIRAWEDGWNDMKKGTCQHHNKIGKHDGVDYRCTKCEPY